MSPFPIALALALAARSSANQLAGIFGAFLEPDEPFPHLNESKDLKAMFQRFALKALKHSAIDIGLLFTIVLVPAASIYLARS